MHHHSSRPPPPPQQTQSTWLQTSVTSQHSASLFFSHLQVLVFLNPPPAAASVSFLHLQVLVFLNPPPVSHPPPRCRQPTAILTANPRSEPTPANPPISLCLSSKFINVRPPTTYLRFRFPASISTSSSDGVSFSTQLSQPLLLALSVSPSPPRRKQPTAFLTRTNSGEPTHFPLLIFQIYQCPATNCLSSTFVFISVGTNGRKRNGGLGVWGGEKLGA
ncbi:Uncharacterized protein Fot_10073 [Forsythia ovata]|uniref:Uncharacterized protein n=1 Tax=Forsythia ovata TaxID=205694 RepID=A0ABD1WID3_9LAMI